jgi:hypothetical protein
MVPISHTVSDGSARSVTCTTSGPNNQFYVAVRQEHWSQPFLASANRKLFQHKCRKCVNTFAICGSAIQRTCHKHIYVRLFFASTWTTENISEGFGVSLLWPPIDYSFFHKNQTTEGGYELTKGTSLASNPEHVRLYTDIQWYLG